MVSKDSYLHRKGELEQVFLAEQDGDRYLREHSLLVDKMVEGIVKSRSGDL
jgi:hypothetical protein